MTRIDFHTGVSDRVSYTCRLVRKARSLAADARIVILLKDRREMADLDQALWTFSAQDFLPHAQAGDACAAQSPIILTDDIDLTPHHDILINLSGEVPVSFARFERVFEVVSQEAQDTDAGRTRYGYYRQRGYPLTHSVAGNS